MRLQLDGLAIATMFRRRWDGLPAATASSRRLHAPRAVPSWTRCHSGKLVLVAATLLLAGCLPDVELSAVRARAASDFARAEDDIEVGTAGGGQFEARGCGHRAPYLCTPPRNPFKENVSCAPVVAPPSMATAGAPPPLPSSGTPPPSSSAAEVATSGVDAASACPYGMSLREKGCWTRADASHDGPTPEGHLC
jgi:hypothetical protein